MGRITNFIDLKYVTESACASGQPKSGDDYIRGGSDTKNVEVAE